MAAALAGVEEKIIARSRLLDLIPTWAPQHLKPFISLIL
jgi:hypothetical protein